MNFAAMFSRLLESTTNSYKYLFLKAITERVVQGEDHINIDDLIIDMLVLAWYPSQYFKLSFGLQDQIGNVFKQQNFNYNSSISITSTSFSNQLRLEIKKSINIRAIRKKLADYVQYRLLTPFFSEELRGKKDQVKNSLIFELAENEFETKFPLYRITSDKQAIILHSSWCDFIKTNTAIINNYQKFEWVSYLQKNNPNVPSIIYKTEPPIQRSSLVRQQKYWNIFIKNNTNEKCIYTGKPLISINSSLDHFLPWSFVCHDRLWNLIPVCPISNSSKGNNLPNLSAYLSPYIEQQFKALAYTKKVFCSGWHKFAEPYVQDLGFNNFEEVTNDKLFEIKVSNTIKNQISLAEQIGFDTEWRYK